MLLLKFLSLNDGCKIRYRPSLHDVCFTCIFLFYFPAISTMDSFPSCLVSPVLAVSVWRSLYVSD